MVESTKDLPADDWAGSAPLAHDRILHHQASVRSIIVVVVDELVLQLPEMVLGLEPQPCD
jgi:hypothetical protein